MKAPHEYRTPDSYRTALDTTLSQRAAAAGELFARRRQLFVFGRFLARAEQLFEQALTLKGGLALELRLDEARSTKDIDLRLTGNSEEMLARLQACGRLDLGDWLRFEVRLNTEHSEMTGEAVKYGGQRFVVEGLLGGKRYADLFKLDIVFGGPFLGEAELLPIDSLLGLDGIFSSPSLRVLPIETHVAEKLHAYSEPRPSSRVKDLPDIALLATIRPLEAVTLRAAFTQTFEFRKMHPLPATFANPPVSWEKSYAQMASEHALRWKTLAEVVAAARAFVEPLLSDEALTMWDPTSWSWGRP